MPFTGKFSLKSWGDDSPQGMTFPPLKPPVTNHTWAECKDGMLVVADQTGTPFDRADMGGKNYHGLDYPLFHIDIRENARVRVEAFMRLAVQSADTSSPARP